MSVWIGQADHQTQVVSPITRRCEAFKSLKKTVEKAFITAIGENVPLDVETDSSDVALVASLS